MNDLKKVLSVDDEILPCFVRNIFAARVFRQHFKDCSRSKHLTRIGSVLTSVRDRAAPSRNARGHDTFIVIFPLLSLFAYVKWR